MKVAVISDIHGNMPALKATTHHLEQWQPDHIIVNGDIINRGASSLACWQFVQEKVANNGWQVLRGNHEDYVLKHADPNTPTSGIAFQLNHLSYWTYQQVKSECQAIDKLPNAISLHHPHAGEVRFRHASIHHNRDGIYHHYNNNDVRSRIATPDQPAPPLFITSHIHRPYTRHIDNTLLINCGSVGQVADGDRRSSYAQLQVKNGKWHGEVMRVPYDYAQADKDFHQSGILTHTSPVAKVIYHEWRLASPLLYEWIRQYQADVLAEKIGLSEAVDHYLDKCQLNEN